MKQSDRDKCIELGVLRERQRIISLLPEILKIGNIDYMFDLGQDEVNEAIALIKGREVMSEVETTMVPAELLYEVRLDEQGRIIKLLTEHEAVSDGSEGGNPAVCTCQQWSLTSEPYEDHIKRLIKGENK